MKKKYILQGLTCASCAVKIETEVSKLKKVSKASVNTITSSLELTLQEGNTTDINNKIERIVHKHEPGVVVIDKEEKKANVHHEHTHMHSDKRGKVIQLLIGTLIFSAGIVTEYFLDGYSGLSAVLFIVSYIVLGTEIVLRALKNISRGQVFNENFLMSAATIGAFAIGEFPEAVAVMLFYQVGEYFQESAVRKSKKSITDLMDIRSDYANVIKGGDVTRVSPDKVNIGDYIVVKPGEKIPLDGIVVEGESSLDTKSLTGESLPRSVKQSYAVFSGCVNQNGLLTIEVTKMFEESTVAKIIELVENASSRKAPTENFITKFSRYYTPIVVMLAVLLAVAPPLFMGGDWSEWIHRGLVFLVISCPCALVISIPLSFFGGIGCAARKGILVKGGNYLEALNNLDAIVFDKTGTLTKGVFEVTKIQASNGYTEAQVLEIAAYAESYSNHPIALSIEKAYGKKVNRDTVQEYTEIAGYGSSILLDSKKILAGNAKFLSRESVSFTESEDVGTKVHVAVNGQHAGCIIISDSVKPDSRSAILGLKSKGVRKAVMLTGDNRFIAEKIAKDLSLDGTYAELLPHEKVKKLEIIEATKRPNGKLAFVGDGINDAPALARADIGIAMGGLGSDAAIEAADVVLMTDEPSKLVTAVEIAKATRRIVWQNIFLALGVKGIVLLLGAFGIASMWEAVFADVGVSLLAILNAMRLLKMKQ